MNNSPVLQTDSLRVTFAGHCVLSDVTLELQPGDLLWLTGPNGAGKSTLLRALTGLVAAEGSIKIRGAQHTSSQARRSFVFVPDEPALYDDLTLDEHARFVGLAYSDHSIRDRVRHWLDRFGLSRNLEEYPVCHSKGMRQKLSLSLALGLSLPLTLLDEPYNGLDARSQEVLTQGLLERLADDGSVVLSTHQNDVAKALLHAAPRSRVAAINNGQLCEETRELV